MEMGGMQWEGRDWRRSKNLKIVKRRTISLYIGRKNIR